MNTTSVDNFKKETYNSFTPSELLTEFPDCIPVIKKNIKLLKQKKKYLEPICSNALTETLEHIYTSCENDIYREYLWIPLTKWFWYDRYIEPIDTHLKFLERLLKMNEYGKRTNRSGAITEEMIEKARMTSISTLIKINADNFISCPFHKEKTASCKIYKNRFHCFGCGADGDAIQFIMNTERLEFPQAVLKLIS